VEKAKIENAIDIINGVIMDFSESANSLAEVREVLETIAEEHPPFENVPPCPNQPLLPIKDE
jgi:hypothetical protein